jgi:hypothetical protein
VRPIPSPNLSWAPGLAKSCNDAYRELEADWLPESALPPPVECALAADYAIDAAISYHVLGEPATFVRIWLQRAASSLTKLLKQSEGSPPLQTRVIQPDGSVADRKSDTLDRSLTNPPRALLALHLALIVGNAELIECAARNIRIHTIPSKKINDDEKSLALALAALLRGEPATAVFHAKAIDNADESNLSWQAQALLSTVNRDKQGILHALRRILDKHTEMVAGFNLALEPRRILCLSALGTGALALRRDLVEIIELPADNVHFPLELIHS